MRKRKQAAGTQGTRPGKPANVRSPGGRKPAPKRDSKRGGTTVASKRPAAKAAPKRAAPAGRGSAPVDRRGRGEIASRVLAAIVESAEVAIIGKTLDGIVTSWNPSAARIFGYTADEMIGKSIAVLSSPSRPREMEQILERVRRGQRVDSLDTERVRKDGRVIQISLTVSPIRDAKGRVVGASKIARDITARKNTEAQLRAKSAQLEEFAHALNLASAMVRTIGGEILFWGQGLEALYGWSAEEAIGRNVHELLATEYPMPADEIQAELLRSGEWQGELLHSRRDGQRLTVASRWALHRDGAGNPVSILESNRDISQANLAQNMIAEREARLRSILDTAPDAIITIDEHGIIQSFSDAAERLLGYARGEAIGRNVNMLMSSPHREDHDGYLARYLRTGEKRIIGIGREVEARRKDGSIFPIDLAVGEARFGGTRIFTGFIRDLTQRARMEAELRQAQRMEAVGQLTGGLAHDFNNLLTVITGNLEMLERRVAGDSDAQTLLGEAQEAAELGAKLSNRLLAFGRRQPLRPEPIDLGALVWGLTDLLRRTLGAAVRIETRFAQNLPIAMADPGQFENALLNLAINARDAMPEGGQLIIETAAVEVDEEYAAAAGIDLVTGGYVSLSVTDTGVGMSPEIRERAFEPFFTTKGPGAGSGLGLSMVYGFVKQSGGHVRLDSEEGRGTTVRLYLPASEGDGSGEAAPRQAEAEATAGETILVVEDDVRVRRVSTRRLKEMGYAVIEAESGSAALEVLARAEPIDLLFTDVVMPGGMTGLELARQARSLRPGLKILFTSGYASTAAMKDDVLTGNAAWLSKPYSNADLSAKLWELLRR